MYIEIKTLPQSLISALASVSYGRADIKLEVSEKVRIPKSYGDGCRASIVVINLATGERKNEMGSWGGANPFEAKGVDHVESISLPEGFAALTTSGYKNIWELVINPKNAAPLLPATNSVSPRQAWILGCFASLTSAGRKNEFSYRGKGAPTEAEIDELCKLGFLKKNKAGAVQITTDGKNNAGDALRRPKYVEPEE